MSQPPPQRASTERDLADRIPGAVTHDVYHGQLPPRQAQLGPDGLPPLAPPPASPPSAWNAPAFAMLGIFLVALFALLFPLYRAKQTEHEAKPLVAGLSGRPNTSVRCPRYITAIFTNVGSVRLDANGRPSDHTDLTGPVCDGLRHFYATGGRTELNCMLTDARCPPSAFKSIVALNVVAHESMHLAGQLDEAGAECDSIGRGAQIAKLTGLRPEQGRMIAWLHLMALNPNTPPQYAIHPSNCAAAADLTAYPPGTETQRETLRAAVENTWLRLGDD